MPLEYPLEVSVFHMDETLMEENLEVIVCLVMALCEASRILPLNTTMYKRMKTPTEALRKTKMYSRTGWNFTVKPMIHVIPRR